MKSLDLYKLVLLEFLYMDFLNLSENKIIYFYNENLCIFKNKIGDISKLSKSLSYLINLVSLHLNLLFYKFM